MRPSDRPTTEAKREGVVQTGNDWLAVNERAADRFNFGASLRAWQRFQTCSHNQSTRVRVCTQQMPTGGRFDFQR